ncbi:MAG: RNA polymerase sigma factor [Bacteroidota bacterium]
MAFLKNIETSGLPDADLVILFKESGDLSILGELYQRHMDLIYGVCLKYLKDPELAKDSVMAIFEELILKLRKHEVSHFKAWLHQVARNHCLMYLRSPRNKNSLPLPEELMHSVETEHLNAVMEKEKNLQDMSRCLETLNPEQRQVVEAFYLQEKSYQEIASDTAMEWNRVRSLIQNGRRNLRICMEKLIDND